MEPTPTDILNELESHYMTLVSEIEGTVRDGKSEIYPQYMGYQFMQGHLVEKPKVLFIGINPGPGAAYEAGWKLSGRDGVWLVPTLRTGPRETLFCYKRGSIRDGNVHWYDTTQKLKKNNTYLFKFTKLLESLADAWGLKNEVRCGVKGTDMGNNGPLWSHWVQDTVMSVNLYPIATQKVSQLDSLFVQLRRKSFSHYRTNWDLQYKEFIAPMKTFIEWLHPSVVVCLGSKAFHDLTCDNNETKVDNDGLLMNARIPSIIGVDRSRSNKNPWNNDDKLKNLASIIAEKTL